MAEICTHSGCEGEGTRVIGFPMTYLNKEFVGRYCDAHADEMLNPDPFYGMAGAREIVISSGASPSSDLPKETP